MARLQVKIPSIPLPNTGKSVSNRPGTNPPLLTQPFDAIDNVITPVKTSKPPEPVTVDLGSKPKQDFPYIPPELKDYSGYDSVDIDGEAVITSQPDAPAAKDNSKMILIGIAVIVGGYLLLKKR